MTATGAAHPPPLLIAGIAVQHAKLPNIEVPLSRLIQGTLGLDRGANDEAERLLDGVFAAGCSAFDTAPVYGNGASERLLGAWIRSRGVRRQVVVIGKGCHPQGPTQRVNPEQLRFDVERSLSDLGLDCIDLYLLHRDDPTRPVDEIVAALNELKQQGLIRAFGASNWTHQRLAEADAYCSSAGLERFSASSPGFSLAQAQRSWPGCITLSEPQDAQALQWYAQTQMPLLAWSPLAGGFLCPPLSRLEEDWQSRAADEFYRSKDNEARAERLRLLAQQHDVPCVALALGYVLSSGANALCVLGCRSPEEYALCARAWELPLSPRDRQWLVSGSRD